MIRILIVDDHSIVRRGLQEILADEADLTVVGEAANAEAMLAFVRTQPCDVVLTDISMPGRSGLEALQEVKRDRPDLPVLVLSVHPEDQYGARALQLGAAGYLTKDSAPEALVTAIRKVVTGGRYVSPTLAERLAFELVPEPARPRHERLSQREHDVLRRLGAGQSVTEIAAALTLSVKTVSTYRARLLEKLAMRKTAELVHYAICHRLAAPPPPTRPKHHRPTHV